MLEGIFTSISSIFGPAVGILSLIVGIAGLWHAVKESRKAREAYREATVLAGKYETLVHEHKGTILNWEALVENIAAEMALETRGIMMALDTLTYGEVTVPEAHKRFWSALLSKVASGLSVQIITFNEHARHVTAVDQHGEESISSGKVRTVDTHLRHVETLRQEGGKSVEIVLTEFFPLHLFIFSERETAIFVIQEVVSDGSVKSYGLKTKDPVLLEVCRKIFSEMKKNARNGITGNDCN